MPLFIVHHQHSPDTCPARDPAKGTMLLNHLSRSGAARHGVLIKAEAVDRTRVASVKWLTEIVVRNGHDERAPVTLINVRALISSPGPGRAPAARRDRDPGCRVVGRREHTQSRCKPEWRPMGRGAAHWRTAELCPAMVGADHAT